MIWTYSLLQDYQKSSHLFVHRINKENRKMRMTSDLSQAKDMQPMEKGIYRLRIKSKNDDPAKKSGNPMVTLTHEVIEGEHIGREIRYDNVVLGGKDKDGKPVNPFRLCNLLDVTDIPWGCEDCKNGEQPRKFYKGQGESDGLVKGKYYCPDCKSPNLNISYDTDTFTGVQLKGVVDIRKEEGGDREFNTIKKYLSLDGTE